MFTRNATGVCSGFGKGAGCCVKYGYDLRATPRKGGSADDALSGEGGDDSLDGGPVNKWATVIHAIFAGFLIVRRTPGFLMDFDRFFKASTSAAKCCDFSIRRFNSARSLSDSASSCSTKSVSRVPVIANVRALPTTGRDEQPTGFSVFGLVGVYITSDPKCPHIPSIAIASRA